MSLSAGGLLDDDDLMSAISSLSAPTCFCSKMMSIVIIFAVNSRWINSFAWRTALFAGMVTFHTTSVSQ